MEKNIEQLNMMLTRLQEELYVARLEIQKLTRITKKAETVLNDCKHKLDNKWEPEYEALYLAIQEELV